MRYMDAEYRQLSDDEQFAWHQARIARFGRMAHLAWTVSLISAAVVLVVTLTIAIVR